MGENGVSRMGKERSTEDRVRTEYGELSENGVRMESLAWRLNGGCWRPFCLGEHEVPGISCCLAQQSSHLKGGLEYKGLEYQGLEYQGLEYQGLEYQGLEYMGLWYQGLEYQGLWYQGLEYMGLWYMGLW